ncbi:MAG: six-cysteine ranthipeptide SCIFF [Oscillospiraceae bacterium]|nr:six-cysteine ranthipeptide SCIFF [Oscillospiraceae bacterium]
MKHVKTLAGATLKQSAEQGGCGNCQASCQSACKTSSTVANQRCERKTESKDTKSA